MKLDMIKGYGGVLSPASDEVADKLKKFQSGEIYPIEIKRARNPQFHGKVFAFFAFCLRFLVFLFFLSLLVDLICFCCPFCLFEFC